MNFQCRKRNKIKLHWFRIENHKSIAKLYCSTRGNYCKTKFTWIPSLIVFHSLAFIPLQLVKFNFILLWCWWFPCCESSASKSMCIVSKLKCKIKLYKTVNSAKNVIKVETLYCRSLEKISLNISTVRSHLRNVPNKPLTSHAHTHSTHTYPYYRCTLLRSWSASVQLTSFHYY